MTQLPSPDPMTMTDAAGLLHRSVEVRAAGDTEAREFTGLGVTYGDEISHYFGRETFDPGSIELDAAGSRVMWQHGQPIGLITKGEDTPDGYRVTGKISRTTLGDEAMTLLRDGVIRSLSIGFEPIEYTAEVRDDGTEVIHWTKVRAREFSLVTFPAYDGAAVESIRNRQPHPEKETDMPETLTRADLDAALAPVMAKAEDAERAALLAGPQTPDGPAVPNVRSVGDFLKRIAAGEDEAAAFYRAYTGGTTADTVMKGTPIGDFTRLIEQRRPLLNRFDTGTLPETGLSVEYVELKADDTAVAEQAKEGDDLAYGKISLQTKTAPIKTYGGWTELSRQEIERASVSILDTTLQAMALRYAKVTDAAVRKVYTDQIAAHLATAGDAVVNVTDPADPFDFLDAIVDGVDKFEERGFNLARVDVSKVLFKRLLRMTTPDRLLTDVNGSNGRTVTQMDLGTLSGDLAGITMNLIPGTGTEEFAALVDPVAIKTLQSPGAPWRLQDENIINLTKQFSIYGYQSTFVPFPDAIISMALGPGA